MGRRLEKSRLYALPSGSVSKLIREYGGLIRFAVMVLGFSAVLFLKTNYVEVEDFDGLKRDVSAVEKVIIRMETKIEHDNQQDLILGDHENRIRVLERKP